MTTERDARDSLELLAVLGEHLEIDTEDREARERMLGLVRTHISRDAVRRLAADMEADAMTLPKRQNVTQVSSILPKAMLTCTNRSGAVLSEGQICLLSAEGGIGKTALAVSIALAVAMADGIGEKQQLHGQVFDGYGGHVLYATYEDPLPILARMLRVLITTWDSGNEPRHAEVLDKISLLDLSGWPLFGPDADRGGSYNSRPGPLPGWTALWREAADAGARLIVLDPALAAYVGEANAPAPVREFLSAIAQEAGRIGAAVLLLAHSTKAARNMQAEAFDPGVVAGSGAWADGVRGVLTMGWNDKETGQRVLRVPKANWGPSRISIGLNAIRHTDSNAIVGFGAIGEWTNGAKPEQEAPAGTNGRNGYDPTV